MFNKIEFGKRLREVRKANGLTQENVCKIFGLTDFSTISRYESGEVVPTIEQIYNFCKELDIPINVLFEDEIMKMSSKYSSNPFKSKEIYVYYKGIKPTFGTSADFTFKIELNGKNDTIEAVMKDIKTDKIYQVGFLNANDQVAIIDLRNYVPTSPMLSFGVLYVSIASNMNGLFLGVLMISNSNSEIKVKKCVISKTNVDWNNEISNLLKYSDEIKDAFNQTDILTTFVSAPEDYEL